MSVDLDELERLAKAATPSPWQNGIEDLEGIVAPYNPGLGNVICIPPTEEMYSSYDCWPANAALIVAVVNALPALIAAARPSLEPPAPDVAGWRLVPVEPTEAMLDEARYFWGPWLDDAESERAGRRSDDPADIERAKAVWAQMIAAAPPHPASKEPGHE